MDTHRRPGGRRGLVGPAGAQPAAKRVLDQHLRRPGLHRRVLAECPFETTRRVVDVSGDGPNNNGPPAEGERDQLVEAGVTINGLPIVNERPNFGVQPGAGLEAYYRNAVIGGPGAFLVVAQDFESLGAAIRRKLIQEIAGRDEDVVPAFGLTRLGRNGIRTG